MSPDLCAGVFSSVWFFFDGRSSRDEDAMRRGPSQPRRRGELSAVSSLRRLGVAGRVP